MASGDKFYLGGQKAFDRHFSYNESVATTEINVSLGFTSNCIKFLSNDDDSNDLIISFGTTATSANAGLNGVIVLKAGEVLNELNIATNRINFRRTSGTGNVRMVVI